MHFINIKKRKAKAMDKKIRDMKYVIDQIDCAWGYDRYIYCIDEIGNVFEIKDVTPEFQLDLDSTLDMNYIGQINFSETDFAVDENRVVCDYPISTFYHVMETDIEQFYKTDQLCFIMEKIGEVVR